MDSVLKLCTPLQQLSSRYYESSFTCMISKMDSDSGQHGDRGATRRQFQCAQHRCQECAPSRVYSEGAVQYSTSVSGFVECLQASPARLLKKETLASSPVILVNEARAIMLFSHAQTLLREWPRLEYDPHHLHQLLSSTHDRPGGSVQHPAARSSVRELRQVDAPT
jgi:hypothetical protein